MNRREFLEVTAASIAVAATLAIPTGIRHVKAEWASRYFDYGHRHATNVQFSVHGQTLRNGAMTMGATALSEEAMIKQETELLRLWAYEKYKVRLA